MTQPTSGVLLDPGPRRARTSAEGPSVRGTVGLWKIVDFVVTAVAISARRSCTVCLGLLSSCWILLEFVEVFVMVMEFISVRSWLGASMFLAGICGPVRSGDESTLRALSCHSMASYSVRGKAAPLPSSRPGVRVHLSALAL